jgi:Holliday junction DNA helicase RuvA
MISKIIGTVHIVEVGVIEVTISSGIGFTLIVKNTIQWDINQIYEIYTACLFSAEKGYTLYGFLDKIEKDYFLILCECQGIGPKLAHTIISFLPPEHIFAAVADERQEPFEHIHGIGKKKANQIIHELKKKQHKLPVITDMLPANLYNDLVLSLKAIGYHGPQVDDMIAKVKKNRLHKNNSLVDLIKYALEE